ncbi:MAG: cation transporter [Candidatus Marinimicrobia bacterium]|nr:cation transporter [Candidatus Neomarinimicrobiota bacterium]
MRDLKSSPHVLVQVLHQQLIWLTGLLLIFAASFLFASWRMQSLIVRVAAGLILADLAAASAAFMGYRFAWQDLPMTNRTARFIRRELLVTFISSLILVGYGVRVALDIPGRFRNPVTVNPDTVFILTAAFLLINILSAWLMNKILNRGGFYLRLFSVITMTVGGFLLLKSPWKSWDPIIAIIMTLLFVAAIWNVFKSVAELLQRGVPTGIKLNKIVQELEKQVDVSTVSQARLSREDEGLQFTGKVTLNTSYDPDRGDAIRAYLNEKFGIHQAILELVFKGDKKSDNE